jgi:glycosyltransferase involved in cell wall biosynthesis
MHIAHVVISHGFAGVERYLLDVAREQQRRGHQVTVVGGDAATLGQALADGEVRHRPASSLPAAAAAVVRSRPLTVVHCHMTAADVVGAATKPLVRARLVSTLHFAKPRGSTGARRRLWSTLTGRFDQQVAISRFVAEQSGEPATVLPNGVLDRPSVDPVQRGQVVLVAQRLEAEKHTELALDAWSRTRLGDAGWQLHIAGDGSCRGALEQQVAALGLAGSVRLLGFVDDLTTAMVTAGMLLATAPLEPFGLAVVEAMASGLPVVAARGGAHLETVGAAADPALFAPDDAEGAAALLTTLAGDPEGRAAYGERLRRHQREHLSLGPHVDELLTIYGRTPPA